MRYRYYTVRWTEEFKSTVQAESKAKAEARALEEADYSTVSLPGSLKVLSVNETDIEGGDLGMNLATKVQEFHNGYIITVVGFLNGEIDYHIIDSSSKVNIVAHGSRSAEEALTNAKKFIDAIGSCPIYTKKVKELLSKAT